MTTESTAEPNHTDTLPHEGKGARADSGFDVADTLEKLRIAHAVILGIDIANEGWRKVTPAEALKAYFADTE